MPVDLRFRQIHLDFHTSPDITGIGADFDPDRFADTLAKAKVDSVTCFARCHHGLIYYQSGQNPERIHPHLERPNLLPDQIEACHQRGIRAPIYTTVQWDDFTADEHRDWLHVGEDSELYNSKPLEPGFYRYCDVFHPGYRQFLFDHTRELFASMPVDGLFFDIVQPRFSFAKHWLDEMDNRGYDPEDEQQRERFSREIINEWKHEMTAYIRGLPEYTDDCTIFYNAGHIGPRLGASIDAYTHYELESLPSGGWGYLHFPLTQRYVRGIQPSTHQTMGMTGKFHTSWGDFHSFKNPAALQFECFSMLAMGARCSVGDQLHPTGQIDHTTYDLIGGVYRSVAEKQPWCTDVTPVSEIGVLTPEEFEDRPGGHIASAGRQHDAALGAVRMLTELGHQFDLISTDRNFKPYRLLILPDDIPVDPAFYKKLQSYVKAGGALIASHRSGLGAVGDAFAGDLFGVDAQGEAPWSPDFVVPGPDLRDGLSNTGYVMYLRGLKVKACKGAKTLARVEKPYFNRTWRHFCSHAHTPSAQSKAYPGVVQNDAVIYFAHPIFTQYHTNAPRWCKLLLRNAIDQLMPDPVVTTDGPSTLVTTLNQQKSDKRFVLHFLHYIPERRGTKFDVIEDIIPLYDLEVQLRVDKKVKHVTRVPDTEPVDFMINDGVLSFTLPHLDGHAMVELSY